VNFINRFLIIIAFIITTTHVGGCEPEPIKPKENITINNNLDLRDIENEIELEVKVLRNELKSYAVDLDFCLQNIKVLNKNIGKIEKKLEENKTNDCIEDIKELEKKLNDFDVKLCHVSVELNENMVGRMGWQLTWFLILLAIVPIVLSVLSWLGYKLLERKLKLPLAKFKDDSKSTLGYVYNDAKLLIRTQRSLLDNQKSLSEDSYGTEKTLRQSEIIAARMQVRLGDSQNVIVGANILSQLGETNEDISLLTDAIKREGLSEEVRETLERAIKDLKRKLGDKK